MTISLVEGMELITCIVEVVAIVIIRLAFRELRREKILMELLDEVYKERIAPKSLERIVDVP